MATRDRDHSVAPVAGRDALEAISSEQWALLRRRASLLRSAGRGPLSKAAAKRLATELEVHWTTVYRWHQRFREAKTISSLARRGARLSKASGRLSAEQEAVISKVLATMQRRAAPARVVDVVAEVVRVCRTERVTAPSRRSIDRRLHRIPQMKVRRRNGLAEVRPAIAPGKFLVKRPLDVVQIDHTRADITVVDELYREPIGRPYLTVVMDVASRAVLAPVVTFDAPSAATVALSLARSCAPKERWINELGLSVDWPMRGLPVSLHLDNASEFHSKALERGCAELGIELIYRPLGRPHFGGHIERLIGTLMSGLSTLPGATGSSVKDRKHRDPQGRATLTLRELETWLALEIGERYHHAPHRGLSGATPYGSWQAEPPTALDPAVLSQIPFVFLPAKERRVRRDGVHFENVRYWHPAFSTWAIQRKMLLVRFDPRDISRLYARGSKGEILEIPYADLRHPPISIWELKAAAAHLRKVSKLAVDETRLFAAIEQQRAIVQTAQRKTRGARRAAGKAREGRAPVDPVVATRTGEKADEEPAQDLPEGLEPYSGEIWSNE